MRPGLHSHRFNALLLVLAGIASWLGMAGLIRADTITRPTSSIPSTATEIPANATVEIQVTLLFD